MCTQMLMSWLGWSASAPRMPEYWDPKSIDKRFLPIAGVHVQHMNDAIACLHRHRHEHQGEACNLAIAMPLNKLTASDQIVTMSNTSERHLTVLACRPAVRPCTAPASAVVRTCLHSGHTEGSEGRGTP